MISALSLALQGLAPPLVALQVALAGMAPVQAQAVTQGGGGSASLHAPRLPRRAQKPIEEDEALLFAVLKG